MSEGAVEREAAFSADRRYRYWLVRRFPQTPLFLTAGRDHGRLAFVLLNPSTADAEVDDATTRRCVNFARAWEYSSVTLVNLFALVSEDPKRLLRVDDPVGGAAADRALVNVVASSSLIVCGWGASLPHLVRPRARLLLSFIDRHFHVPHVLAITSSGAPQHPLYVRASVTPQPWADWRKALE